MKDIISALLAELFLVLLSGLCLTWLFKFAAQYGFDVPRVGFWGSLLIVALIRGVIAGLTPTPADKG